MKINYSDLIVMALVLFILCFIAIFIFIPPKTILVEKNTTVYINYSAIETDKDCENYYNELSVFAQNQTMYCNRMINDYESYIEYYQSELIKTVNYSFTGCKDKSQIIKFCPKCDFWISCNSNSMAPTFDCKHTLYFCEYDDKEDLGVGDIILYANKGYITNDNVLFVIHRIVEVHDDYVITKGDNYYFKDDYKVSKESIKGKLYRIEA